MRIELHEVAHAGHRNRSREQAVHLHLAFVIQSELVGVELQPADCT
jgi:hypothetical protein